MRSHYSKLGGSRMGSRGGSSSSMPPKGAKRARIASARLAGVLFSSAELSCLVVFIDGRRSLLFFELLFTTLLHMNYFRYMNSITQHKM